MQYRTTALDRWRVSINLMLTLQPCSANYEWFEFDNHGDPLPLQLPTHKSHSKAESRCKRVLLAKVDGNGEGMKASCPAHALEPHPEFQIQEEIGLTRHFDRTLVTIIVIKTHCIVYKIYKSEYLDIFMHREANFQL